jgi:hypothetical protein
MEGEVDDGSMLDPRTSTALRALADLTAQPPPPRWAWTVGRLDAAGRLCLGSAVVGALGPGPWRLAWHHLALVVTPDPTGDGPTAEVDERGRLGVPGWLRQRGRDVLVGLDPTGPVLLVAPVEVLDGLGDVLAGRAW